MATSNEKIPIASQVVAIGAASVASTPVGAQTYEVLLSATGNCHIAIGNGLAATAASTYLPANAQPLKIGIRPGNTVAVIQDATATGNLSITELSA